MFNLKHYNNLNKFKLNQKFNFNNNYINQIFRLAILTINLQIIIYKIKN